MRSTVFLLAALLVGSALAASGHEIVIEATAVRPPVLTVKTGERVDFRNAARAFVHLEFTVDPRQHEVVQVPVTGPMWAVFHRPGTHPYLVHVVDGSRQRTLNGVVDVVEDETHRWDAKTCGVVVMGECLER